MPEAIDNQSPARQHAARAVGYFAELAHRRASGDYAGANAANRELERQGVYVSFDDSQREAQEVPA